MLALLFVLAVLGIGMAALASLWETALLRDKEAELLFVGDQYRRALESFFLATPGPEKHYPTQLQELLADPRFPNKVRHLRRLYRDPLAGSQEWGLVRKGKEITGVYSLSGGVPMKKAHFPKRYKDFAAAASYRDWVFSSSLATQTQDVTVVQGQGADLAARETAALCENTRQLQEQTCGQSGRGVSSDPQFQACMTRARQAYQGCLDAR